MNKKSILEYASLRILIKKWKDGTIDEVINDWRWIFSYSKKYKGAIFFYTLLGIFSTTMGLVSAVAGKYMIDIITGYQMDKLWIMILVTISSVVASMTIGSVTNRISTKLSIDINNDIQADIFDQIMDTDWLAISDYSNGDILNRFNNDVGTVSSNAISWLPTIVIAVYNFVATFAVIWHYDRIMSLIAFASAPFMLVMSRYLLGKQREYSKKVREMSSEMMTFEVETFYNTDTIKSFGLSHSFGERMRNWQKRFKKISLDYNLFTIKTNILMTILSNCVQYLAFGYCLFRLWTHDITYGTMTLFLQQRSALSGAFSNVISIIPNFLNSSVSAHRIRELVELPKEEHLSRSKELDRYVEHGFTVRMNHLTFSYKEGTEIIHQSEFQAAPGQIVALVGPSGEGKTTMIRLILGLVKPQLGEAVLISENGIQVEMNADIRHLFSYVPQGNTIISGSIADNLRMVKEDATDDELISVLKAACAWDFVKNLDNSLNTMLGERGRGLSEGQAQRIAIARALLRDAPILLLDEATSALDITTERMVLKNIIADHPTKTCIVTTHRPSVLNMCHHVYRVIDKQVKELDEDEASKMAIDF